MTLKGVLVPLQKKESSGRGRIPNKDKLASDEDFPLLEYDHRITGTHMTTSERERERERERD